MDTQTKLQNAYVKAGGKNVEALPWADIIAILVKLFAGCTAPKAKQFVKLHPRAAEFLVSRELTDNEFETEISSADRKALSKGGVAAFPKMTDEEIDAFRDQ